MKIRLLIAALFALNINVLNVHAGEEAAAKTAQTHVGSETLITLNATVTAVNQQTREITLTDDDGNSQVITVGDEVKNLPQVAVGDKLSVSYFESVTFEVLPPGMAKAQVGGAAVMDTAEPGQKPAAAATTELSVVATVEAINKEAGTVDLKGPAGDIKTVKARDPQNLDKVKVGDQLLITMTKAVAVSVTGASADK